MIAAFREVYAEAVAQRTLFSSADLSRVTAWSCKLEGDAGARLLMAQLNDTDDAGAVQICAHAIAASPSWEKLVRQAVRNLPTTPITVKLLAGVFAQKAADHPLSALVESTNINVTHLYDALIRDGLVKIRVPGMTRFDPKRSVLLMGLDFPLNTCLKADIMSIAENILELNTDKIGPLINKYGAMLDPCLMIQD